MEVKPWRCLGGKGERLVGRGLCTMLEDFLWKLVGETFFEHIGENQGASGKAILMTLKPF